LADQSALRRALEVHRRAARDDRERADLRKVGDQFLGETVAEIGVVGVRAEVRERQHDDRAAGGPDANGQFAPGGLDFIAHVARGLDPSTAVLRQAPRDEAAEGARHIIAPRADRP
jgi:hypothetical protein